MKKTEEKSLLQRLMSPGGRVDAREVRKIAEEHNEQHFIQLIRHHCLVGGRVLPGEIEDDSDSGVTLLYRPSAKPPGGGTSRASDFDLSKIIFPLVGRTDLHQTHFSVGQNDENDIVISDYSISRKHLSLSKRPGNRYFLTDRGSKNRTELNGHPCPPGDDLEITDGQTLRIGRYEFFFLSPTLLYAHLRGLKVQTAFRDLINSLGRADYNALKEIANRRGEDIFMQLVCHPALVGMGLFKGYLVSSEKEGREKEDITKLFINEDPKRAEAVSVGLLTRHIYPILHKSAEQALQRDFLAIGRTEENDLCMADHSISRAHAQIRLAGDGYYFYKDYHSTNGSWINGEKLVEDEEIPLNEGDRVHIGRYLFTFVFPSTLYRMLKEKK